MNASELKGVSCVYIDNVCVYIMCGYMQLKIAQNMKM